MKLPVLWFVKTSHTYLSNVSGEMSKTAYIQELSLQEAEVRFWSGYRCLLFWKPRFLESRAFPKNSGTIFHSWRNSNPEDTADNLEPIHILKSHKSFPNIMQSNHKNLLGLWYVFVGSGLTHLLMELFCSAHLCPLMLLEHVSQCSQTQ